MKKSLIYILFPLLIAFIGCESNVEMTRINGGTPSILSSDLDASTMFTLTREIEQDTVLTLNWTIVDYISGDIEANVLADYALELSTSAVSEPLILYPPNYLHHEFKAVELNVLLNEKLGGVVGEPIDVSFKIVTTFDDNVLSSNVVTNTFVPYPLIPPPAVYPPQGDLYITGPGAEIGWPLTTKFTKVSDTYYTLSTFLNGNKRMEFVTENWDQAYKIPSSVAPEDVIWEGMFVEDGNKAHDQFGNEVVRWEAQRFLSPPNDGIYTITLDFQEGTYKIEEGAKPAVYLPAGGEIYIHGAAVGNPWPIPEINKMTRENEMKYSIVKELIGGKNYNFLADAGWNQVYKVPAGIDVNSVIYEGSFAEDGDLAHDEFGNIVKRWENQNFISPPNTGTYKLTLDFLTGTYTVEAQ